MGGEVVKMLRQGRRLLTQAEVTTNMGAHNFFNVKSTMTTLANNLVVATTGIVAPAASIVWKIPAGSRFEQKGEEGLSHYLRHSLFAGNTKDSGLAIARKAELCGAMLSISNNRDSLTIAADCPHEEAHNVLEIISNMIQHFHLEHHQLAAIKQKVAMDRELMAADVDSRLWTRAFEISFRDGIGHSPVAADGTDATIDNLTQFMSNSLKRSGHVLASSGIDEIELVETVKNIFSTQLPKLKRQSTAPRYHGGEDRIALKESGGFNEILVAFGTGGFLNTTEHAATQLLSALIGYSSPLQYGNSISQIKGFNDLIQKYPNVKISCDTHQCFDGGLFGLRVSIPSEVDNRSVLGSICHELKSIACGNCKDINDEKFEIVKKKASFKLAHNMETRITQANALAEQVLIHERTVNLSDSFRDLQTLSLTDFKSLTAKLLSRKAVMISVGNLRSIPYSDEISS